MFVVEIVGEQERVSVPGVQQTWRQYAIDRDRGYALYPISERGRGRGLSQILVAGDQVIPFDTWHELFTDPGTGHRFVDQHLSPLGFGRSRLAEIIAGVKPFVFSSVEQKHVLLETAAEAVLVFTCMNVEEFISHDGRVKVVMGDRIFTRSSFNYPTSR